MSARSAQPVRAKAASSRVKDFFFGNLTAKAMSLVMALALWFYAYGASRDEETWTAPVEIKMTEGWTLSGEEPKVSVTAAYPKTSREEFKQARAGGRIRVMAALTPEEPGSDKQTLTIELGASNFRPPSGLKASLRGFEPSRIEVSVVREDAKVLPVRVRTSEPPAGFAVSDLRAIPGKATVRGPRDVLSKAEAIETEPVDISNLRPARGERTVNERVNARIAQYVTVAGEQRPVACDREIQVQVVLDLVPMKTTFTRVPIRFLTPYNYPYVAEIRDESERASDVEVSGPADIVEKLKPENIVLYVDVTDVQNLKPKTDSVPYTQPIHATIVVDTPRSGELTCRPLLENCHLTIGEPPAP